MKLFCLKHTEFDCSNGFYYRGPDYTQQEFKSLCDSLLRDVAKICLEKNTDCTIHWSDLIDELDVMLCGHGFERLEFAEVEYVEGIIGPSSSSLLGDSVVKAIQKYNQQIEDKFHTEIDQFRLLSENPLS